MALCIAFEGSRRIASGELDQVALAAKEILDRGGPAPVLIFDDLTGTLLDLDFRGTAGDLSLRLKETSGPSSEPRRPGRPKLGVVAREITLLPRHWEWLNTQPGGASVALRKLVEQARRVNQTKDRVREAQEAAYRFLSALAGNEKDFEEALRALFAGQPERFDICVESWPPDVRDHARKLAARAFA